MKRELAMRVMIKASVGGLLDENYSNRYNDEYKNTDDLSEKNQKSFNNCMSPLIMLHWAQHIRSTSPYVMLRNDTKKYKEMFPDKDVSELVKDENLEKFPSGRGSFLEDSTGNPFQMMVIDHAPDTEYETYMATIDYLIKKKQELDKKYPNRLEELKGDKLSEKERNERLLINPRRDYKDKFWKHNGQKTVTQEQYNKILDSYTALLNKGFRADEYVDSRAYTNLLKDNFNVNYDEVRSFDPLAAASDIIKADKTQKEDIMDDLTEKKAAEYIKALDMMNAHMDKCIADGKPETFADIKGFDVKVWFDHCKIPPIVTYDVESKIEKNYNGDEEVHYTKLEPTILDLVELYKSDRFDPDLNTDFSQKDIDKVMEIFNTDKKFFTEELRDLYRIKGDKNRGNAQVYQTMHYESLSEDENYKFNRFRSALFNIKLKDENVMKLGDDNNPIYTTKFTEADKSFEFEETTEKETKMLGACKKMLNDARQKRNSAEYDNIQKAITNMEKVISDKNKVEGKTKSVLYTEKVEEAIIAIGRYYAHKAKDGETDLSTQHKYPVIQRIEKVLMDRYEALTGKTFIEDHPDMKDFYNTEKAVKDKKGNLLKGDEYVRSISKQRIKNVEKIRKDLKLGKSKLSEKTFNTREQNEAESVIQRSNSVGAIRK